MNQSSVDETRRDHWLFLGSALILTVAVVVGLSREQRWGESTIAYRLISRDATGLRIGQEVRISGLPVGQVHALQLRPDARVAVDVQISKRYASLVGPRSLARLAQEGFVGEHYLVITPDPQVAGPAHSLNGRQLTYEQPPELGQLLQQVVQIQKELQTTLRHTSRLTANDVPNTLAAARASLGGVQNLAASLQRESSTTGPELREALRQLSRTSRSAEETSTQAQLLLRSTQTTLIDTLRDIQNLTRTSQRLLQGLMGLAGAEGTESSTGQH